MERRVHDKSHPLLDGGMAERLVLDEGSEVLDDDHGLLGHVQDLVGDFRRIGLAEITRHDSVG